MRIVLAGLLGAIAMFVWTSVAHMATPLATIGVSKMTDESVILDAFKHGIGKRPGLYFFPWVDPKDPKMMAKEAELAKVEPTGILIYQPPGASTDMVPQLVHEYLKETAQSLIAAALLSMTLLAGYLARVGFVVLVGVFSVLGADMSYLIWYRFPRDYTLATITIEVVGALAAGLVIAAIVKPRINAGA